MHATLELNAPKRMIFFYNLGPSCDINIDVKLSPRDVYYTDMWPNWAHITRVWDRV